MKFASDSQNDYWQEDWSKSKQWRVVLDEEVGRYPDSVTWLADSKDIPLPGKILLTLPREDTRFVAGDELMVRGRLKPLRGLVNPGGFDTLIRWQSYGCVGRISVYQNSDFQLMHKASSWRNQILQSLDQFFSSIEPGVGRGLLRAWLIGDQSDIPSEINALFRQHGLSHLVVLSGMHLSALSAFVYALMRKLLQITPGLFLLIPRRIASLTVSFILVSLYCWLCVPTASLLRAWLALVVGLALWWRCYHLDLRALWLCVGSMLLCAKPSWLYDLGFQLSMLCLAALLVVERIFKNQRSKNRNGTTHVILIFFITGGLIWLWTAPWLAYTFGWVSLSSIYWNWLFIPLVNLVALPVSILATLWGWLIYPEPAWLVDLWVKVISQTVALWGSYANKNPGGFSIVPPTLVSLGFYYLGWCLVVIGRKNKRYVFSVWCLAMITYVYQPATNPAMKVVYLDVGQGESHYVQLPSGERGLIDVGGSKFQDPFLKASLPYLNRLGVKKLDWVILTHEDWDHWGSLETVLKTYEVGAIYIPSRSSFQSWQTLFDLAQRFEIPVRHLSQGDRIGRSHESRHNVFFEVLWPKADERNDSNNDGSLVLALRWKSVQVLFTGDISRNVEMALASSKELRSSVLKVAHHGSRTSSHPDFIREVSPEVALISCGRGHAYGHPHREVLQTLNDQGVAWYSTSTDGGLELNVFHDGKFTIHPTRKWRPVREWIPTHSDGI